jgi:hypothetical protein
MHEMVLWRVVESAFGRESERGWSEGAMGAADRVIGARLPPLEYSHNQFSSQEKLGTGPRLTTGVLLVAQEELLLPTWSSKGGISIEW